MLTKELAENIRRLVAHNFLEDAFERLKGGVNAEGEKELSLLERRWKAYRKSVVGGGEADTTEPNKIAAAVLSLLDEQLTLQDILSDAGKKTGADHSSGEGSKLVMNVRRVGETGSFTLIEGAPGSMKIDSFEADVEDVDGKVKGVTYRSDDKSENGDA